MNQRSDEDKIARTPVMVKFDGKEYPVAPLVRGKSRAWREKVVAWIGDIMGLQEAPVDGPSLTGAFQAGITKSLIGAPEKLAEFVTEFAPNLTPEILDTATDEEISVAFSACFQLAFPHLAELGRLNQVARTSGLSQSQRFLN